MTTDEARALVAKAKTIEDVLGPGHDDAGLRLFRRLVHPDRCGGDEAAWTKLEKLAVASRAPAPVPDRISDLASAQRRPARVHFALIPDENDDEVDANDLLRALQARGTRARVNLVAYNPPPGEPSDPDPSASAVRADAYMAALRASPMIERVKQILPVGRDVHAACGMFAGPSAATSTYNPDESETT